MTVLVTMRLAMGLASFSKCLVMATRHLCGGSLRENGSLDELRDEKYISFLVVLEVRDCKRGAF